MIVASYERDVGNTECLIPVVPKDHPITSTGNRHIDAPRNTTHPTEPQATEQPIRTT